MISFPAALVPRGFFYCVLQKIGVACLAVRKKWLLMIKIKNVRNIVRF